MPYIEVTNTYPGQAPETYSLCNNDTCPDRFGAMFGIADMSALPVTIGKDTYTSEKIFEDSNTYHANCFVCGTTVWCGADCTLHDSIEARRK